MARRLKIDVVSDVVCPWCAIGLAALDVALQRLAGAIEADVALHPFELNPDLPPEGENGLEHVARRYGISPDQVRANRDRITERAAEVGFAMNVTDASRIRNSFDAHRLIAWAGDHGRQREMGRELFGAYFTRQEDIGDRETLVAAAVAVGLDAGAARAMLASADYADRVRDEERLWRQRGIDSVPAVIVDDRYLISGGQPPAGFERQLRAIAAADD